MDEWYVNADTCIECGLCIEEGEGFFDYTQNGEVYVKGQPGSEAVPLFQALAQSCPVGAIKKC